MLVMTVDIADVWVGSKATLMPKIWFSNALNIESGLLWMPDENRPPKPIAN